MRKSRKRAAPRPAVEIRVEMIMAEDFAVLRLGLLPWCRPAGRASVLKESPQSAGRRERQAEAGLMLPGIDMGLGLGIRVGRAFERIPTMAWTRPVTSPTRRSRLPG